MQTYIVDAFTDVPFKGNPAGVCLTRTALTDHRMLQIAQELNLSETAFIQRLDSEDRYSIRYFSPKMEIPLCGHATLAAAKVVSEASGQSQVHFVNINGLDLVVRQQRDELEMEFPIYETQPAKAPPQLILALGIEQVIATVYNAETRILLIEIESANVLTNLKPDFAALYASHDSINGVLVTAKSSDDDFDFYSRYFWPWSGTNEDPVTGGTHTFLAKYWATRLGKQRMRSFQCSSRTGSMHVELRDHKLLITSQAVIVFEGRLRA
jgi:PhzF family phenazine biosynthesis protein